MQLFRRFYKTAKISQVYEMAGNSLKTLEEKLSDCGMKNETWQDLLKSEYGVDALNKLMDEVEVMYKKKKIKNPEMSKIFGFTGNAEILPNVVRVVILGQDPSENKQGLGYGFGTENGTSPSLQEIFDCIKTEHEDINPAEFIPNGKLDGWISQGVLLLNSCPVFINAINAGELVGLKADLENITLSVIRGVLKKNKNIFFILMGMTAKRMLEERLNVEVDIQNRVDLYHPAWSGHNSDRRDLFDENFSGKRPFTIANIRLREIHAEIGKPLETFKEINWKQF